MTSIHGLDPQHEPPTVVGLLDGLIDQGVHVAGDLVIGLADLDLIRVALRLLIASEDTAQRTGVRAGEAVAPPRTGAASLDSGLRPVAHATTRPGPTLSTRHAPRDPPQSPRVPSPGRARSDSHRPVKTEEGEHLVHGVTQLVLTVVELIRDLVERQAIRRVEAGSLTTDQVERLGVALQALEERMEDVKDAFGLTDADLNLNLGPLGRLR